MISKERLEELIKEGAMIYCARKYSTTNLNIFSSLNHVYTIILNSLNKVEKNFLSVKVDDGMRDGIIDFPPLYFSGIAYLDELYETKEQAEWHLKYHKTRTEELDLPMWEEFKNYTKEECVAFVGENWEVYELSKEKDRIILTNNNDFEVHWAFKKENYIEACDLCLKLFKGE